MDLVEANIASTCPLAFNGIAGDLFLKAVSTVVAVHCTILDDFQWPPDSSQKVIEEESGNTRHNRSKYTSKSMELIRKNGIQFR